MASIIDLAQEFVLKTLNEKLPKEYLYHNYNHTQRVVKHVKELIEAEGIEGDEAEMLELAAWMHDIGYVKIAKGHENVSAEMAREFLTTQQYAPEKIQIVENCILATSVHTEPQTKLEMLLVDADFSHFASKNYEEIAGLLREELRQLGLKDYTDLEWVEENIKMYNDHHKFYTVHAMENWQPQKSKNLLGLLKTHKKLRDKIESQKLKKDDEKRKSKKANTPERGIETMYRVSLRNHIALSSIADTKANILLSVNAIIISLALSNLFPKLDNPKNTYLIVPTIIFIAFSVASMVLSVIATRPNVTQGKFSKEDVENKKVNLLFFGNFHKMNLEDFEWAMGQMMSDRDYLYSSLSKDLYFLGKVLDRKYRILRITYTIFMVGIITSVAVFAIASKKAGVNASILP